MQTRDDGLTIARNAKELRELGNSTRVLYASFGAYGTDDELRTNRATMKEGWDWVRKEGLASKLFLMQDFRIGWRGPDSIVHGKVSSYTHGCRCTRCKTANAAYHKGRRKQLRTELALAQAEKQAEVINADPSTWSAVLVRSIKSKLKRLQEACGAVDVYFGRPAANTIYILLITGQAAISPADYAVWIKDAKEYAFNVLNAPGAEPYIIEVLDMTDAEFAEMDDVEKGSWEKC